MSGKRAGDAIQKPPPVLIVVYVCSVFIVCGVNWKVRDIRTVATVVLLLFVDVLSGGVGHERSAYRDERVSIEVEASFLVRRW